MAHQFLGPFNGERWDHNVAAPLARVADYFRQLGFDVTFIAVISVPISQLHHHDVSPVMQRRIANQRFVPLAKGTRKNNTLRATVVAHDQL